ncbi:uncharacterized protein LOC133892147 [Phragmites australis]|uniref:uncharacterized protein LOC133892147 n=1 Tax=Phragmites australis TaxID=29695 RepID=UPI002D77825D|nr:uncharacterized protein LOC133892147 [Phragmites australis]
MGKDKRAFPLSEIDEALDMANGASREIFKESMISVDHEHVALSDSLNVEQRVNYDEILAVVDSGEGGKDAYLNKLIDNIFLMLDANLADPNYITLRAILSTRNECVDTINMKMIGHLQWDEMEYYSFDRAKDDLHNYYPPEFLNSLTPNGLPPYVLKLKVNYPIILLRNIDPANGLCNRTRLIVWGFQRNAIDAEIVLGMHAGKRVFLPRIPLCPSDDEMFPFQFKRKQFPVGLALP